jgi:signal transduction histidine kinase
MINVAHWMKGTYSWLRPEGPVTISNGVLLYAPSVVRAGLIIFCAVGIFFSIPYCVEHLDEPRLVITRIFVVTLACFATFLISILIERHYRACIMICTFVGTTVTVLATTYMDGPSVNPHAMLVTVYVLGAGLCLGRRAVLITLGWVILNLLAVNAVAGLTIWPHPTNLSVEKVQYENISALFFMLLSITPVLLGYLGVVERSIFELQQSHAAQAHLLQQVISTREGERKQLSYVLHEGPVQDLVALRLAVLNNEPPKELIALVDSAVHQLRTLSSNLHPPILDLYGLPAALDQLAIQKDGATDLEVNTQRLGRLDPGVEIALFRIAQEALTNIQKHSNARHAWIQLSREGDSVELKIQDNGVGFDVRSTMRRTVQSGHFGLASMHELATSIDGQVRISSILHDGTTVTATVPYRPALSEEGHITGSEDETRRYVEDKRRLQ